MNYIKITYIFYHFNDVFKHIYVLKYKLRIYYKMFDRVKKNE